MTDFINEYDELIHAVNLNWGRDEIAELATVLFPDFNLEQDCVYDSILTPYCLEVYAYNRSIGMSVVDAAHSVQLSSLVFTNALKGKGVSLQTLINLAQIELYEPAQIKASHLKNIEDNSTSRSFLQMVFPEYRDTAPVSVPVNVNNHINASTDPEQELKNRGIPVPAVPLEDVKEPEVNVL